MQSADAAANKELVRRAVTEFASSNWGRLSARSLLG